MNLTLRARLAAFAVGVAILGACSDQVGPLAPDGGPSLARKALSAGSPTTGSSTSDPNVVAVTSLTRNDPLDTDVMAEMVATPDSGGMLQIPEAGLIVYVPPGAVDRPTTITARALAGSSVAYEFG